MRKKTIKYSIVDLGATRYVVLRLADLDALITIGLQLSRFPGACDHWEVCDPRWPGMIAIRLEQLGQYYVPVDGERFLEWLSATPDLTWQHVVNMLAKKRKQLNKRYTHNGQ